MDAVLLTPAELARRWDTTEGRLANLRSQGKGPAVTRIGRRCLYAVADVLAYEAAHRTESTA